MLDGAGVKAMVAAAVVVLVLLGANEDVLAGMVVADGELPKMSEEDTLGDIFGGEGIVASVGSPRKLNNDCVVEATSAGAGAAGATSAGLLVKSNAVAEPAGVAGA